MQRVLPFDAILIPKDASRVFQGDVFSVYNWKQELFDGTSSTFEMLKRPDTMVVVAIREDKVVLLQEKQPNQPSVFHFPGGRVNSSDGSWAAAAQRELREETGLSFRNLKLIYVSQPATKIEWFVAWYIATDLYEESAQALDNGEQIEVISETIENAIKIVRNTNKTEAKYIPDTVLDAKSIKDLLDIPEYIGDTVDSD